MWLDITANEIHLRRLGRNNRIYTTPKGESLSNIYKKRTIRSAIHSFQYNVPLSPLQCIIIPVRAVGRLASARLDAAGCANLAVGARCCLGGLAARDTLVEVADLSIKKARVLDRGAVYSTR